MIRFMTTRALVLAVAATFLACSSAPAQQPSSQAPGDTAARIGDRTITVRDLDDKWMKDDPAQNAEAIQMIYDGRRAALETIIADSLLAEAAKGSGMSDDGYDGIYGGLACQGSYDECWEALWAFHVHHTHISTW